MSALPALEFFSLVVCARRRRAEALLWEIAVGSFAHADHKYRRGVSQRIDDLTHVGQTRRNALDLVPEATKIQMIGFNLRKHGDRWAAANPQYMRWLASAGVSREEAIRRHEEWHTAEMRNPFWSNLKLDK